METRSRVGSMFIALPKKKEDSFLSYVSSLSGYRIYKGDEIQFIMEALRLLLYPLYL